MIEQSEWDRRDEDLLMGEFPRMRDSYRLPVEMQRLAADIVRLLGFQRHPLDLIQAAILRTVEFHICGYKIREEDRGPH